MTKTMNKFKIIEPNKTPYCIYYNTENFTDNLGNYYNDQAIISFCFAMIKHNIMNCTFNDVGIERFY